MMVEENSPPRPPEIQISISGRQNCVPYRRGASLSGAAEAASTGVVSPLIGVANDYGSQNREAPNEPIVNMSSRRRRAVGVR